MLFKVLSVLALSASSVLAATPTLRSPAVSFNPLTSLEARTNYHPINQVEGRSLTNAKRLAAHLPLAAPSLRRRRHGGAHPPTPSGTPGGGGGCTTGHLEVRDHTGKSLGHVGSTCNKYGQYGITHEEHERLIIEIDLEAAKSGAGGIKTTNGPDEKLPFLGGISGYESDCSCSDLKHDSHNYAYLGATVETTPWAAASLGSNSFTLKTKVSRTVQSSIFTYDATTSIIKPQWINEDGAHPNTFIGYYQDALFLAGDKESFVKNVGQAEWVSLVFVAIEI